MLKIKEVSVGGIIYRIEGNKILFLLLKQSSNKLWEFPKGNIEKEETELDCAKREIKEEAGINPEFNKTFREEIKYINPKKGSGWLKKEIMYLCKTNQKEIKLSWEHERYFWGELQEIFKLTKFQNIHEIVKKAHKFILETEIIPKYDRALKLFEESFNLTEKPICYFVTGSYYQKNLNEKSDLDIFVVNKPDIKRKKGVSIIEDIKVSFFINPINKVYDLLLSEAKQIRRPTAEMIFYSEEFLDKKQANQLKKLANKTLEVKTPLLRKEDLEYIGWKIFDKMESLLRASFEGDKSKIKYLEINLLDFLIESFFKYNQEYIPHTKYQIKKINKLDKNFDKYLREYLSSESDSINKIMKLSKFFLEKINFKKLDYSQIEKIN